MIVISGNARTGPVEQADRHQSGCWNAKKGEVPRPSAAAQHEAQSVQYAQG